MDKKGDDEANEWKELDLDESPNIDYYQNKY